MQEIGVAKVEDIIDQQMMAGVDEEVALVERRFRHGVVEAHVGDAGRVGQRRIAQPDPDQRMTLDRRVSLNADGVEYRTVRICDACARCVELQAMIAAGERAAIKPAEAESRKTMRTAILERRNVTLLVL
jgi:hypothetical protein